MQRIQQGFTLLELLVVITLLALLATAGLVAYEGIGESAADTAAANNIKSADSAIRTFRAVENVYPNQWDNLANVDGELAGGAFSVLAETTREFLGQVSLATGTAADDAVLASLSNVGINELQTLDTLSVIPTGFPPNEFFNESSGAAVPADEVEWEFDDVAGVWGAEYDEAAKTAFNISIVPSSAADGTLTSCTLGTKVLTGTLAGATVADSTILNRINDHLDSDGCHMVVAVGFGKDVPGTTLGSKVAVSTAPTYSNGNVINPSVDYARYIALFHVGSDGLDESTPDGSIGAAEILPKARLLAVVDTEGRNIDQAIAGAFASN